MRTGESHTDSPVPLAVVSPHSEGGETCRKTKPDTHIRELSSRGSRSEDFNLNLNTSILYVVYVR